ncbi:MFS transporter [Rhodococcus sp. 14-2686-1-2]|nr:MULTISPECIES: MFS transporter [unclassified Rhodococcus (in: high G+C Gram-positive bacteria)]OZE93171.1 MFS transporter [Rhodococcus sp. 15-1189-1-1a]OZF08289.1 MFS transporter [Rhodococcus sp. 14-2686-1-2]
MGRSSGYRRADPDGTAMQERRIGLIFALCFVVMTTAVLQTAVVPLLPTMANQLSVGPSTVGWVVTANLLAAAVFTPLLSKLADQRSPRRVLLCLLVVVLVGSVLCVSVQGLIPLLIGRVLQGTSFALFPIGVAILRDELDSNRMLSAIGIMSGILAVGGGVGMVVTGLLQRDGGDYRRIFWFLLILNLLTLAVAWFAVPRSANRPGKAELDPVGAVLMALGLTALLICLAEGGRWGWLSAPTVGFALFGVASIVLWLRHEHRVDFPLVPPHILSGSTVAPVHLTALLVGASMYVQFLGAAQFVQAERAVVGYGFDASVLYTSVVVLLPGAVAGVLGAVAAGRIAQHLRAGVVMASLCLAGFAGFVALAFFHDHLWQLVVSVVIVNVFVSGAYAMLPALLADRVASDVTGIANGVNAIARTFGSSIASAALGTLATVFVVEGTGLPSETAYTTAFAIGGIAAAAAGLVALASEISRTKSAGKPDTEVTTEERQHS